MSYGVINFDDAILSHNIRNFDVGEEKIFMLTKRERENVPPDKQQQQTGMKTTLL